MDVEGPGLGRISGEIPEILGSVPADPIRGRKHGVPGSRPHIFGMPQRVLDPGAQVRQHWHSRHLNQAKSRLLRVQPTLDQIRRRRKGSEALAGGSLQVFGAGKLPPKLGYEAEQKFISQSLQRIKSGLPDSTARHGGVSPRVCGLFSNLRPIAGKVTQKYQFPHQAV